ncbi:MAG: cytochrome c biogenesis CcdA family protein [Candidatus Bathyarchaeia archaeon]|nr:cytochrome c biogenesis protein CcdA [Candidatus Bathyarchaeota archaeon]
MSFNPLDITLALTAGVFTLLSPCSFPLLPGYISYYLGLKSSSYSKAVVSGLLCASGIIIVFSTIGLFVSAFGSLVSRHIPLLRVVAGAAVILMGIIMAAQVKLPTILVGLKVPREKGVIGIFLYGAIYGLASANCSAPIFFSIIFYSSVSGGLLYGTMIFIAYAMGIGLPIIAISIFIIKAKEMILRRVMRATPLLQIISGLLLIIIGIHLIYSHQVAPYL